MARATFKVNDIVKLKWRPGEVDSGIRYRITKVGDLMAWQIPERRLYVVHYWSPERQEWMTSLLYEMWIEKAND